jgi:hypothetical protein
VRADLTILVPARDEEARIGGTVLALRGEFSGARVVVADDGSRDRTVERAEEAGAAVVRLPRLGKGQTLSLAERTLPPGPLLLADADLRGSLGPLLGTEADIAVAAFARRTDGGFGIAKRTAGMLIRLRTGRSIREPLSGQRYLSQIARRTCFPLAPGFGCETRMTIDALRAGLALEESELDLEHRPTGRGARGFAHRGRQLADALLACGPLTRNFRGLRLPVVGWAVPIGGLGGPATELLAAAVVAGVGLADDLWSGPERGVRAHLQSGGTTGVLKLVAVPAVGIAATRSVTGGLMVGLTANALNQLDTRPGRAVKAFLVASLLLRGTAAGRFARVAVLLLPYDLRERTMLGDAGSNSLGAVVGLGLVQRLPGRARWAAIMALAGLNLLGERRSLGALIESTPVLRQLDALGRRAASAPAAERPAIP